MEVLSRKEFREEFRKNWATDHHVSMIGPTGRGKSTVAKTILGDRPGQIMILSAKGPDETTKGFGKQVKSWPPPVLADTRPNARGQRIIRVEPPLKKPDDFDLMRPHFLRALEHAFAKPPWTVYVDELYATTHPEMLNLRSIIDRMMVLGRSRHTTIVSASQAPRWVPKSTYDQAQHVLLWRQRDKLALGRISEISGVDTKEVQAQVLQLPYYGFLWVDAARDELYQVGEK